MGTFFSRLKSGNKLSVPAWASTDGWWWTEEPPLNIVAGESFYEAALSKIVNRPRETGWLVPLDLVLQREPRNKHDKNAIAVKTGTVRRPGEQLGHVARDWAAWLAPVLDATRAPLFQVR